MPNALRSLGKAFFPFSPASGTHGAQKRAKAHRPCLLQDHARVSFMVSSFLACASRGETPRERWRVEPGAAAVLHAGRDAPPAMYRRVKCQAGGQGSAWPLIARNLLFDPLRAAPKRSRYQFRKSGVDQSTVRGGPQAEHGPDPAVISTAVSAQAVCRPPALIGSLLCSPFCVGKQQQHSLLFFSLLGVLGPGSGPTLCLQPSTP